MKLYKAQVVSIQFHGDPTMFVAEIMGSGRIANVNYTSPFNSMVYGEGGFTAYPREGDVVLISTAENDPEGVYYYMSTVIGRSLLPESGMPNYPKGSKKFHVGNAAKETIGIADHYGGGLEFVSEGTDGEIVSRRHYSRFYSGNNEVLMDKNPEVEAIIIRTKDDSVKIKMTGPKNSKALLGPNAMSLYSRGNMDIQSHAGDVKMYTHSDGGTITIINMARPDRPTGTPKDVVRGDLNMESLHNSVNIKAHGWLTNALAPPAKVFIEAQKLKPDALVQVQSGGDLKLFSGSIPGSQGKTSIVADGDINIVSRTGAVNIIAPVGGINLQNPEVNPADFVPSLTNKGL